MKGAFDNDAVSKLTYPLLLHESYIIYETDEGNIDEHLFVFMMKNLHKRPFLPFIKKILLSINVHSVRAVKVLSSLLNRLGRTYMHLLNFVIAPIDGMKLLIAKLVKTSHRLNRK
jgi:hypothetical protein